MKRWSVLMRTEQYIEVEAETPAKAEMEGLRMYQRCEVRPEYPIFVCEEQDVIDDEENE
jgi:hypothetical protein